MPLEQFFSCPVVDADADVIVTARLFIAWPNLIKSMFFRFNVNKRRVASRNKSVTGRLFLWASRRSRGATGEVDRIRIFDFDTKIVFRLPLRPPLIHV